MKVAESVRSKIGECTPEENLRLNDHERERGEVVLRSTPVVIEFGVTTRCNMRPPCVMCCRQEDGRDMQWTAVETSMPFLRRASVVSLHSSGEPLMYPRLMKLIGRLHPQTRISFVSNGLLLTEKRAEALVGRVAHVNFSIDAATPETYAKIRHNSLERVRKNVRRLVAMRDRAGSDRPRVTINMCLMQCNMHELPAFIVMAREIGADRVSAFHANVGPDFRKDGWFNYAEQHCHLDPVSHDRFIAEAEKEAELLGVEFDVAGVRRFSDTAKAEPPNGSRACAHPWRNMVVFPHGKVVACCYQVADAMSMSRHTLAEIWNGPVYRGMREGVMAGGLAAICSDALPCPCRGRI